MDVPEGSKPFPARPTITAPFACAMVFWASCAASYSSGDVRSSELSVQFAVALILVLLLAIILAVWPQTRGIGVLIASLVAGLLLGNAQAAAVKITASELDGIRDAHVEMTLLEDSRNYGFGETALVEARISGLVLSTFTARFGDVEPILAGEHVIGEVSCTEIDYSLDGYAWTDGACGQLKVSGFEHASTPFPLGDLIEFRRRAIEGIGGGDDARALLQALVCGYRRNVSDTEMYSQFQTCGLAHLVAVSGAHLVIVTGLMASILKRLRVPRRPTVGLLIALMASYFIIAGMPVSALRAVVMSSLGLIAYFGKRRASSLNAIGIATFAIIALSPASCVSASFALSALSTAGIVLFAPLFQAWIAKTPIGGFALASDAFSLTMSASLLSQLYACSLFHQLPLMAPVANLVTAPLFPVTCGSGLVWGTSRSLALPSDAIFEVVSCAFSSVLAGAVGLLSQVPYASVPFTVDSRIALSVSAAAALILWCLWPRPNWMRLGALSLPVIVVAFVLSNSASTGDALVALDVGQGDAILVQSKGRRYLVDTGNQDSKLLEQLALNHVTHLDGVIITHADDDHCGSLDALKKAVQTDRVILAGDMLKCNGQHAKDLVTDSRSLASELVGVSIGDSFRIGSFTARVVWPRAFSEDGGNADSLCLLLSYDGDGDGAVDCTALLTGDAEKDELAEMIESGDVEGVDILKVGHHGSRNGSTPDEMGVLHPKVAMISCGERNRYGHPSQEVLDQLSAVGAETYRTDRDGEIRCKLSPEGISISCIE